MMLPTVISVMMDKCEAVFSLNTPNALTTKGSIEETSSPWLYGEIGMTGMLRKRPLKDYRLDIKKALTKSIQAFNSQL